MQRLPDWQSRLGRCVAERMVQPFEWGRLDCVLFAADCIEACTGTDPAAEWRGTYQDARSAMATVQRLGGLRAIAAKHLGPEIAPALAQAGDVGIVECGGRECLAVCTGPCWHASGAAGLVSLPFDSPRLVWRVNAI